MQKGQALEPVSRRANLLNLYQILEMITDSDSDEPQRDVAAMKVEEYYEEVLLEPHLWLQSEYTAYSSAQAPLSPDSARTSEDGGDDDDDDDDIQSWPDPQTQQPQNCSGHCCFPFRRV